MSAVNLVSGVNVAGYVTSEFGLGECVRSILRALEAVEVPVAINNCTFNAAHRKLDSSYQTFSDDNPYPVNLIQVNPDLIPQLLEEFTPAYFKDKYNIGFWAWELPKVPEAWQASFSLFNEIWTCSSYSADAIARSAPIPVIRIPLSVVLPEPSLDRTALKLPPNPFIFLFMFDFCSVFERKNPTAVVQAFQQAFSATNPDVLLVLKFSNAHLYPKQRDQLKAMIQNQPNIHLIDGYLLKQEVSALIHQCDCYVSLHRSEGFGFTMAEAMYYGKPVIATAFSGNMDFMNVGNSFLVKSRPVVLAADYGPYQKGSTWADPDVAHAAELMRQVFEQRQHAQTVGARAAEEVRQQLNPNAVGALIRDRLAFLQQHTQDFTNFAQPDEKMLQVQAELQKMSAAMQAMKSSKFWQLREAWLKLKQTLKR